MRRLHLLRAFRTGAAAPIDRGAGFEFALWRAYALPHGGHIEVILDRVRLVRGEHLEASGERCPMCHLALRRIDAEHDFCTAGCDARTLPARPGVPARRLPDDGIVERQFAVRGRFDSDPVHPITDCLLAARGVAEERNADERANHAHVADLFERARGLQSPAARAGMAGACWVSLELDERTAATPSARVTVRRTAPGQRNGIEVASWPLYAVHSTWERTPGAAERRRDADAIEAAARRVAELADESYRPRYARLRSSLSSRSEAGPSSTTSPVEST
jgi:hypothetical protein